MVLDYITEKKLRPLYEAIDDGQHKQALQLANKLLKKNPDWVLIKALKAVVLIRTGKDNEARILCQQVKEAVPTDNATLQAITMAYRELGEHSAVVELYENAANQQPKNEEFGNHWFMAMVRNDDYKGQQQAALKLHRTFKQNKYLFWTIMSLALQGKNSSLSYTLAERMMAKAQEEGRLEEVEHIRLYLLILLDQKKNEQALALLQDTPLGQKSLRDPEVRQIKTELLLANQKWTEVLKSSEQALRQENSDDWISWRAYFDAVEALVADGDSSSGAVIVEQAYQLVKDLKESARNAAVLKRGPFLAELELDHRLRKMQKGDDSRALANIVSYFSQFGSKACCFEDIQSYVSFLRVDVAEKEAFIKDLQATIGTPQEKADRIKAVQKTINIRKIERFLGLHSELSLEEGLKLVNDLWHSYEDALPLGEGLEKTENQYGDDFVLLSSHVLLDLYRAHKQSSLLIQAICFLETALLRSMYNFHIKLTLVRLYAMLGVYKRPMQIFRTMDIKQIQYDTMTHYFTDRFISLGCTEELESVLSESLMIYRSNEIETPEMLVKAYQYGTFSKIQEFIEFRRRLELSLQQSITNVELIRLDALRSSFQAKYAVQYFQELDVSKLKFDDAAISAESDNRDFKVFLNCNPEGSPRAEELFKATKSTGRVWLQAFSYILSILSAVCDAKGGSLDSLVEKFSSFLERPETAQEITAKELSLATYVKQLASALVLVKDAESRKANSLKAAEILTSASKTLENELFTDVVFDGAEVSWHVFHAVSIAVEAFDYGSVLIEMTHRALSLTSKDARRKAAENANNDVLLDSLSRLQSTIKQTLSKLQTAVRKGVDLFNSQLQRDMASNLLNGAFALEYFKKDSKTNLADVLQTIVNSWSASTKNLAAEIDRRVLKLQQ